MGAVLKGDNKRCCSRSSGLLWSWRQSDEARQRVEWRAYDDIMAAPALGALAEANG